MSDIDRALAVSALQSLVCPSVDAQLIEKLVDSFGKTENGSLTSDELDQFQRHVLKPLREFKVALLVVDFQNDFVSGSLALSAGDAGDPLDALPALNSLVIEPFLDMVVYTQDWHPHGHISFYEHANNEDRELSLYDKQRNLRPFDTVEFKNPDTIQKLYPTHCVQDSWGAELHPDLRVIEGAKIVKKGTELFDDSYSAFEDNQGKKKSELEQMLRSEGISAVLACGLAYDICVMHTLKDAANLGFMTAVVTDSSQGLSLDKMQEADKLFAKKGVAIISSEDARDVINRRFVPFEWAETLAKKH